MTRETFERRRGQTHAHRRASREVFPRPPLWVWLFIESGREWHFAARTREEARFMFDRARTRS